MAVTISYDKEGKLLLEGLACACGCEHHPVNEDIYIGQNILHRIPNWIIRRGLGTNCVLVADGTTYDVAGRLVETILREAGFAVTPCVIQRAEHVLPDDGACGEVLLTVTEETEFLIAVGSGSITDTTRINAARTGLPFVSVGTAPSMDGYASVISPLIHRGIKIQRKAVCPKIIVCDLHVLATAPMKMVASGVGDVFGKFIALAEWKFGQVINGEPYCPVCGEIVLNAVNSVMDNIDEIAGKTAKGMRLLVEALLLAGVAGIIVGNTRPVASVEHAIAQYWEMIMLKRGLMPPMHGASVGVATLLLWPLFERFAKEDVSRLDLDEILKHRMPDGLRKRWMLHAFGEEGGQQIMRANPEDFLTAQQQRARIMAVRKGQAALREIIAEMPPKAEVERAMRVIHAEMTPEDEHIPDDLLRCSMWCGKDYRSRYTLLKVLDECGLLPEYLENYPYDASF